MYPVSDKFLQAVQENTRKFYWTGRITTNAGVLYEFGIEDRLEYGKWYCGHPFLCNNSIANFVHFLYNKGD